MIEWDYLPKNDHIGILQNIPIGDYVHRLPLKGITTKYARIPIPQRTPYVLGDANEVSSPQTPCLEFEAEVMVDKNKKSDFAWRRVK